MLRIVHVVLAVLITCCPAWAASEPIVTTDLLRIRSVTSIDVARDGSRAAFAVRSIATIPPANPDDPEAQPTYRYQSHLFLLDLVDANATPRQLTFGDRNDGGPMLSPDGKRIAFVRDVQPAPTTGLSGPHAKASDATSQVWMIPIDGGEARQLTNFEFGCDQPRWSPDGRRLLVSSSLPIDKIEGVPPWPMERPKRTWNDVPLGSGNGTAEGVQPRPAGTRDQIRAWLERNAAAFNPNVINRIEFQDEHSLRGAMRFTHLFLIDPDAPVLPVSLPAARRITSGFYHHDDAVFMPDGQSVLYVSKKPVEQHLDRVLGTSIWRINLDGTATGRCSRSMAGRSLRRGHRARARPWRSSPSAWMNRRSARRSSAWRRSRRKRRRTPFG